MYNVLAVTFDGRPISTQTDTSEKAFQILARWAKDNLFPNGKPLARFFIGVESEGVEEYTEEEILDERNWR